METTRNHTVQGLGCMVNASSFQFSGAQATLAQKQPYAAKHCLEESTIEEVLIVSTVYDERVFPVPSCNTSLPTFLDSRHVDRLHRQSKKATFR